MSASTPSAIRTNTKSETRTNPAPDNSFDKHRYLASMLLMRDPEKAASDDWPLYHNYLIDSAGFPANPTKLFFYIFSAGGGTGAGMAAEFASAQQAAFRMRTLERRRSPLNSNEEKQPEPSNLAACRT